MSTENKTVESIPAITIRFAGDSGDGMQLVGTRFTDTSAVFGNDLATLPAFPAEIRAPQELFQEYLRFKCKLLISIS